MKKITLFLVLALVSTILNAQTVTIPDANFKNALLNHSPAIDSNNDGEIQITEATNFTGKIDVYGKNISNLTGIEKFTNITELSCSYNELTTLDVSENTDLKKFDCYSNKLTTLDVSKNTALIELSCFSNQLTTLNVSKNTDLKKIECYFNRLTALDVSKNTDLIELYCFQNQLTALNVSENTFLKAFSCTNNKLTTLDVSKNTALTKFNCSYNKLTTLNVSKNTALKELECPSNQLTALDVSKNTVLTQLICNDNLLASLIVSNGNNASLLFVNATGNANLTCIQHDAGFRPSSNWYKDSTASWSTTSCLVSLTINTTNGNVTTNPNPTSGTYNNGTNVELTAVPNAGYQFVSWSGDATGTTNPITVTMNADKTVTATFSATASINDETFAKGVEIYPNPVNNTLYVKTNNVAVEKITLFNVLGKKVLQTKASTISVTNLSRGVYLVKIEGKNGKIAMKKIIKE